MSDYRFLAIDRGVIIHDLIRNLPFKSKMACKRYNMQYLSFRKLCVRNFNFYFASIYQIFAKSANPGGINSTWGKFDKGETTTNWQCSCDSKIIPMFLINLLFISLSFIYLNFLHNFLSRGAQRG